MEIEGCLFTNNFANEVGGGILGYYNAEMKIKMCKFSRNFNNQTGGAILVGYADEISIEQSVITNNKASQSGAIRLENIKRVYIRNARFYKNEALSTDGGALSFARVLVEIDIEECIFQENTANFGDGGAIIGTDSMNVNIQNSEFKKNEATVGGAAFFSRIHSSKMTETAFKQNKAIKKAGAVAFHQNVSIDLHNCEFRANTGRKGGAISFDESVEANIFNTFFFKNEADEYAGGLLAEWGDNVFVNMNNITCVWNIARQFGGCIGSKNGATFKITGSKFSKNKATLIGDAYAGSGSSLVVRDLNIYLASQRTAFIGCY